jgi:hypothetical protein
MLCSFRGDTFCGSDRGIFPLQIIQRLCGRTPTRFFPPLCNRGQLTVWR